MNLITPCLIPKRKLWLFWSNPIGWLVLTLSYTTLYGFGMFTATLSDRFVFRKTDISLIPGYMWTRLQKTHLLLIVILHATLYRLHWIIYGKLKHNINVKGTGLDKDTFNQHKTLNRHEEKKNVLNFWQRIDGTSAHRDCCVHPCHPTHSLV